MIFDSIEKVFYVAIFIMPGFIITGIIDCFNPPKRIKENTLFLKYIFYSIINCAVWSWLYNLILKNEKIGETAYWILLMGISIFGSTVIGLLIAIVKQNDIVSTVFGKCNINTIHSTPTAWDYYFSQQEESYIIITLLNDDVIYGWYSVNSFSSSDPEERDIFIEKEYNFQDGQWIPDKESAGVYISKDQIKVIEFKRGEYDNAEKDNKGGLCSCSKQEK